MTDTNVQSPDVSRFSTVDEVEDPQQLIEVLDVAKQLPGFPPGKAELLDRLLIEHASSALDVGCGYAANVIALAKRLKPGGTTIGVDVSEAMITEARRRTAAIGPHVSFLVADALALPFDDNTFDMCRTETVLQHLTDPGRAVSEMIRVTRPGVWAEPKRHRRLWHGRRRAAPTTMRTVRRRRGTPKRWASARRAAPRCSGMS